ncbi:MAG TPA: MerR family transcriptional regulator [Kofleriaceae bacterium]|nr:MerR family transcriptional regulator [Kofleriaceae bacterium]
MAFTVGELAKLTGITVRALHHYDELGLVVPSQRTDAGYRLYDDGDVLRLQQVLLYRELGMPLGEIAAVLDDPAHRRADALREHREVLIGKRARIDAMVTAIDAALGLEEGRVMKDEQVKSLFDGFDPEAYADEARERWGDSDAYKESARRTKRYGKAEWDQIRREADAINARLVELMGEGARPDDARVRGMVETHRAHIDRWFYPCSAAMHRNLAELYVGDPRFEANLDRLAPGFARFLHDAIVAAG